MDSHYDLDANEANPTSFYVDDVQMQVCGAAAGRRVHLSIALKSYL